MKDDAEGEANRLRPLSGGIWTLFSWLRREERSSSESVSSAGSDHTTTSFSFLPPTQYITSAPYTIAQGPLTDTYKERVRERHLRRQFDCDLTLRRKYGLFRAESSNNQNTFSLPSSCRTKNESFRIERDRRATSEFGQRRAPYVVGKRRAPLPPGQSIATIPSSSTARRSRKRPAPQPPVKDISEDVEVRTKISNVINPHQVRVTRILQNHNSNAISTAGMSYGSHKQQCQPGDTKPSTERSFLRQILEKRKRNSAIETTVTKLLPSISELDKEAAELIKMSKERNISLSQPSNPTLSNDWICTFCLKRYNGSIVDCLSCINNRISNVSTQTNKDFEKLNSTISIKEEKLQLKKMLKDMKDSLPKKNNKSQTDNSREPSFVNCPTLPIGSTATNNIEQNQQNVTNKHKINNVLTKTDQTPPTQKTRLISPTENVVITQTVVLQSQARNGDKVPELKFYKQSEVAKQTPKPEYIEKESLSTQLDPVVKQKMSNEPLSISSLLNPVDRPKPLSITSLLNPFDRPKRVIGETKPITSVLPSLSEKGTTTAARHKSPDSIIVQNQITSAIKKDLKHDILRPNIATQTTQASKLKELPNSKLEETSKIIKNNICNDNIQPTNLSVIKSTKEKVHSDKVCTDSTYNKESSGFKETTDHSNIQASKVSDQYSRRRELITLLEQSIARGDEQGAAEAATKLAQLRLSCSVLSFSSNIVRENTAETSGNANTDNGQKTKEAKKNGTETQKYIHTETIANCSKAKETDVTDVELKKLNSTNDNKTSPVKEMDTHGNEDNVKKNVAEPSTSGQSKDMNAFVTISVYVEDKECARGATGVCVRRGATLGELRAAAAGALGVPRALQRWIVGRALCTDDNTPLHTLAGDRLDAPFYLCLVESETSSKIQKTTDQTSAETGNKDVYKELIQLELHAYVANTEVFECGVCMEDCKPGDGVILRDCVHTFCKNCLSHVVRHSQEPIVTCPATDCSGVIQEREIRALVTSDEYERWLARGLAAAESGTRNSFHCRTKDCTGWALCEPGVRRFPCSVCKHVNCVPCQAIHEGETCEQHRLKLQEAKKMVEDNVDGSQVDDGTRILFDSLISRGEALECPECKAMIIKKWGCDWVKCSACKTEICWVTRGRRWGPAGRGDVSGGCRCGVDGNRCHPSCGYCH